MHVIFVFFKPRWKSIIDLSWTLTLFPDFFPEKFDGFLKQTEVMNLFIAMQVWNTGSPCGPQPRNSTAAPRVPSSVGIMLEILEFMEAIWHTLCMGIPFTAMRDMATTPVATVVATPMASLVAIAMAIAMAMVTSLMAMAMATSPAVMEVAWRKWPVWWFSTSWKNTHFFATNVLNICNADMFFVSCWWPNLRLHCCLVWCVLPEGGFFLGRDFRGVNRRIRCKSQHHLAASWPWRLLEILWDDPGRLVKRNPS